jgi:hypothetical protein
MKVMRFVYPDLNEAEIKNLCAQIDSVYEFQARISYPAMKLMSDKTIDSLSYEGLQHLSQTKGHLIISNHRDIILDSAILNIILFINDRNTTETAIGSNLLSNPTVRHLTKLNKNFTVQRGGNSREIYDTSLTLSSYIRKTVRDENQSVWISQREGRAKDGNDRTQQGLLKMFAMSSDLDMTESFAELNMITLSASYEYDPCDSFKIKELLAKEDGSPYVKEEEEDLRSIVAGISGRKGRVHFEISEPLDGIMKDLNMVQNKNEKIQILASHIDRSIHRKLHLFPNNYYAADVVQESESRKAHYNEEDVNAFNDYMEAILLPFSDIKNAAQKIFLQKYAWPVFNKEEALVS